MPRESGSGASVLVFTRKRDEAIIIGDGIEVRVLRVGRDGVRLGVVAPPSVAVHRREIYEQARAENRSAAAASADALALARRFRSAERKKNAGPTRPFPDAGSNQGTAAGTGKG